MLQPAWLKAGITSWRKLTGAGCVHPLDLDRRLDLDAPPPRHDRRRAVRPAGTTCPLGETVATSGSRLTHSSDPGQVADRAVGVGRRDDELPGRAAAGQGRVRRRRSRPRPASRAIRPDRHRPRPRARPRPPTARSQKPGPAARQFDERSRERASVAPLSIFRRWAAGMSYPPAVGSVVAYPSDPAVGAEGGRSGGAAARPRISSRAVLLRTNALQ